MKVLYNIFTNFLKNSEHKKYFLIYLISIILCYPIESIILPYLTGHLVNILYEKKKDIKRILIAFGFIIFSWIINTIAYYGANVSDAYLAPNFVLYFRNFIMEKLFIKYENNYDEIKIGIITSKLITLPENFKEIFDLIFTYIIPKILIIIIISIYLTWLDYKLGIIILISFTFLGVSINNIFNKCIVITKEAQKYFENINENYKDKLSNIFSIFSSNKIKDEIDNTNITNNKYKTILSSSLNCINNIKLISYINNIFLFCAINIINIFLFKNNKINGGQFVAIFLTLLYYLQYLMDLSYLSPKIIEYYGVLKNSEQFLENLETIDNDNRPDIIIKDGNIKLKNIYFGYNNKLLFDNLNIEFESDKKVAIIGKSGSGKSTIIKLIMGYYKINEGEILIDKNNIYEYNIGSIRKNISYINQNTKLFNLSVYDNILYGNENKDKKYIDNIIKTMNIENIYKNLEQGLETNVGVDGEKLSGGQKQITFLIRELIGDKKIFILDEPTSALDENNKQLILDIIKKIKEKTVIIITHDMDLTKYVDITYLINDGVITKK
jgi:ABC-type multidrug transport system fused ATPase/permease subunit